MTDKTCSIEGCDSPHLSRGWCRTHYMRWKRHGDPAKVTRPYNPQRGPCAVEACERQAEKRGWCTAHYQRWQRGALTGEAIQPPATICALDGCEQPHKARGYCDSHYQRVRKHGDPGPAELQEKVARPDACTFDGCDKPVRARLLCGGHYRQQRDGEVLRPLEQYGPRGQGTVNAEGYRVISVQGKVWLEHRYLADRILREHHGRPLLPPDQEEVHHWNGDRLGNVTDGPFVMDTRGNLISGNLEVWSKSQPAGQEIGAKVSWAFDLIDLYEADLDVSRLERLIELGKKARRVLAQRA